jgi:Flp pilus assembly protein TadG
MGGESGAALVETALSATVLLALLIGMMQTFLALYGYHYVAYAAREGSRWAMVRGGDCYLQGTMPNCNANQNDIQTYVRSLGFPGIDSSNVTVTAAWDQPSTPTATAPTISWSTCSTGTPGTGCNAPGHMVVVDVTYAFPLNIPFVSNRTLNMTSTSSMVISQ